MPNLTGLTRSSVQRDHALITPESHVPIAIPGWHDVQTVVLISPEMGAGFSQHLVTLGDNGEIGPLSAAHEALVFVLAGEATLSLGGGDTILGTEGYACLPAGTAWRVHGRAARILIFFKRYEALADTPGPAPHVDQLAGVKAEPFLGDEAAMLQVLVPDDPAWDWGINVFEFAPGGTLPQVESHFMEHGLYLLNGEGVYRLGESWYPVCAGDAIWMSAYLLQWFAATGKTKTRYIYYKEMHRAHH